MLLNEFIVKVLEKIGCEAVFYVPGGAAFHLIDAVSKSSNLRLVPSFHEQASTIAAESYFKVTGKVGVVLVTAGPGLSNTGTGLLSSSVDRVPMIVISGQAQSKYLKHTDVRLFGPQAVSASKLFGNFVPNLEVDVSSKADKIDRFLRLSSHYPHGPRILQIPLDLQKMEVDGRTLEKQETFKNNRSMEVTTDFKFKKRLKQILMNARRPIILLGGGVRNKTSQEALTKFYGSFRVPLLLSWVAKDILSFGNPNFCGLPGYFCNRAANAGLFHADVIVAIGCRLDPLQMGYQPDDFFKSKQILVIDNDQAELAKHPLNSDDKFLISSDVSINSMTELFKENNFNYPNWTEIMRDAFLSSYDEMINRNSGPFVDPYYLVDAISDLKPDTYVAGSSGGSAEISFLNFRISENQKFLNSPGLGSMGFAIPSILGALEGEKQASVICVVGDGGLQMNIQELATISRYRERKVLIIVLNNSGYDSMRRSLRRYFGEAQFVDQETGLFFPSLENFLTPMNSVILN